MITHPVFITEDIPLILRSVASLRRTFKYVAPIKSMRLSNKQIGRSSPNSLKLSSYCGSHRLSAIDIGKYRVKTTGRRKPKIKLAIEKKEVIS